ncbi:MAG: 2-C-methyl-D-erythritol 4-phosphate cytidylyltransferase [Crocinitomicaceae bacterium]|nr:2-C-methyl-D-erythritol 4-phosphate cytidylyltransferase [Crocinitomicaceae bacterium]
MVKKKYAVIVTAGGIGKRMGAEIPKQFLMLEKEPILMRTIRCFHNFNSETEIIVTLPYDWQSYWQEICENHAFTIPHKIVDGGNERFDSIKNALSYCDADFVAIHDGVRPLLSSELIAQCFLALAEVKAVVPALPLKESLRKGSAVDSIAVDRSIYFTIQTPQCFHTDVIKLAYQTSYQSKFTDDASVYESAGGKIKLIEGEEQNRKITTPYDLKIAEMFLSSIKNKFS